MCGIAGGLALDGRPVDHDPIKSMTDALVHRGPDEGAVRLLGSGALVGRAVAGLGHRRLKVIDLTSAAAQPMRDAEDRGCLAYNGELYNAADLRRDLEGRGVRFRSRSDTEVVLNALLTWEPAEALARFNGMFALAFWDARRERLLLARDRYGEKPLYYACTAGRLLFASEIEALAAHGGLTLETDPEAIELFLTFGYIPAPWTIYREVRKLPHAALLEADADGVRSLRRYYRLEERIGTAGETPGPRDIRAAIDAAVRRRLEADVPLGAFLSGGIDSSAVVTFMSRAQTSPPHTYSVGVPGSVYFDESGMARRLAGELGTEHHEVQVDARRLVREIPVALRACGEPFADSSAIPCSVIAAEARRGLTVALSGDGSDEIFGGYRLYRALAAARHLARVGAPARAILRHVLDLLPSRYGGGLPGLVHNARRLLDGVSGDLATAHTAWLSAVPVPMRAALLAGAGHRGLGLSLVQERYHRFGGGLAAAMAVEVDLSLPDDMLAKVDRTSMRHSLEVRAPFLDPALVEMALACAPDRHFSARAGKILLRRSLRGVIPDRVLDAPKRGFEVPVGRWIAGDLAGTWHDMVTPSTLSDLGLEGTPAASWHEAHARRRADHGKALWALFVLCHWQREIRPLHLGAASASPRPMAIRIVGARPAAGLS